MNHSLSRFPVLALFALAGCTHAHRAAPPASVAAAGPAAPAAPTPAAPAPAPAAPEPLSSSIGKALGQIKNMCLGPVMATARAVSADASEEEKRASAFENYYNGVLDVKSEREYIECLKKVDAADVPSRLAKAKEWLKSSEDMVDRAKASFPEEKRIVDVKETFSDVDEKTGRRRVVITLRDGTQTTKDSFFPGSGQYALNSTTTI